MPAEILYRTNTTPVVPVTTTAKNAKLTNAEVDGNFKSLVDELNKKTEEAIAFSIALS